HHRHGQQQERVADRSRGVVMAMRTAHGFLDRGPDRSGRRFEDRGRGGKRGRRQLGGGFGHARRKGAGDRAPGGSFGPMTRSGYPNFSRSEWAGLRANTPLTLSEADLMELQGLNEQLSMDEVIEVYLPLSRLLNLHVAASRELERVTDRFLGKTVAPSPY